MFLKHFQGTGFSIKQYLPIHQLNHLHKSLHFENLLIKRRLRSAQAQAAIMPDKCTDYESAVLALNSLQSNAAVIEKNRMQRNLDPQKNVRETGNCLLRIGRSVESLNRLNIIHVSGTKGKGSTCAFAESMLRAHGLKTAFFSSPHLVHVRERIRINGQPISEQKFADYFWSVYDQLRQTTSEYSPMPSYFKLLTVLAFEVFLLEEVDVALIEVGIGGTSDCTNVIRNPVVCGVSVLDFDHQQLLGQTLPEIAWQKAGIFKPGSSAVTVQQPTKPAMHMLRQRATQLNCALHVAPPISAYKWPAPYESTPPQFGISGTHQYDNVSLAVQLVRTWLRSTKNERPRTLNGSVQDLPPAPITLDDDDDVAVPVLEAGCVSALELSGIESCKWPGRSQVLHSTNTLGQTITHYIDGAHTPRSVQACAKWFEDEMNMIESSEDADRKRVRVLMYSCTGHRDVHALLYTLQQVCTFDVCIFTSPQPHSQVTASSDLAQLNVSSAAALKRSEQNRAIWLQVCAERNAACNSDQSAQSTCNYSSTITSTVTPTTVVCASVSESLTYLDGLASPLHVLTTGSLHLVGALLANLRKDMN